jgi:hypothetical protein
MSHSVSPSSRTTFGVVPDLTEYRRGRRRGRWRGRQGDLVGSARLGRRQRLRRRQRLAFRSLERFHRRHLGGLGRFGFRLLSGDHRRGRFGVRRRGRVDRDRFLGRTRLLDGRFGRARGRGRSFRSGNLVGSLRRRDERQCE